MKLQGNTGDTDIPEDVIAGLALRYPQINVREQLSLMALWLAKNPASRPKRVIRFVETWLKKASPKLRAVPKQVNAWWTTPEGTMEQAKLIGVQPRPGEEMHQFRKRIADRVRAA